jgi:FkbM family methyltransferase
MPTNPLNSWTATFFRRWLPYMSPFSVLRYRNAVRRVPNNPIRDGWQQGAPEKSMSLHIKHPFESVIFLRENTFDFITLEEVVFEQVYKALPKYVPQCERIIDLGANIGLACLYLAACYPNAKIAAVEPLSQNYGLLTKNVAHLIKTDRCVPMQAAVWSTDKALVLEAPEIAQRYNAYTVHQAASPPNSSLNVEGLTIQSIMDRAGFPEVDVIKIDIEGAEKELFKGDLSWLDRTGAIAIEFHGDARATSKFDDIIREHRFAIRAEDEHTVLAVRMKQAGSGIS